MRDLPATCRAFGIRAGDEPPSAGTTRKRARDRFEKRGAGFSIPEEVPVGVSKEEVRAGVTVEVRRKIRHPRKAGEPDLLAAVWAGNRVHR